MPFRSQAQRRWMHAVHPEMARRWERETPRGKLPEKVASMSASFEAGCGAGMAKTARTAGKRRGKVFGVMHERASVQRGQQPPVTVTRQQELASVPPGPEVEKQAAELLEDREDSRLRARAELMKMTPEERKRYLADMSARNHRLAMAYPETKTAADNLLAGGRADNTKKKPDPKQLAMGKKVEREHTKSDDLAEEIARDHLAEIPDYYSRLAKMEGQAKREKTAALRKHARREMPHFTAQDRPEAVKKIYRALKRDHPDMPAAMKARIAARQGKPGKQHQGPPYKGPLTRE